MALSHDLCYSISDIQLLLKYYDSYSSVIRYFTFVMSIVSCLFGLVGNAVVISVMGFFMKKHKCKYWFLNLAIADFFAVLTLPIHIIAIPKGTWPFGPLMCKFFLFSFSANIYCSIYILITLNIARVFSVTQPMFHRRSISKRVSVWICSFIWLFAILLSLPVFFYAGEMKFGEVTLCSYFGSKTFSSAVINNGYNVSCENATRESLVSDIYTKLNPFIVQCSSDTCCGGEETLDFCNHLMFTSKRFVIPYLVIGYFIPLLIVIICNLTIIVQVRKSRTVNTHRLYRVVITIIMVFFLTWTPLVIADIMLLIAVINMNLIVMYNILTFMPLLFTITYTNSFLNPIVYMLSGGQMRTGLSDFIRSIRISYK